MNLSRLFVIALIFALACMAWMTLGSAVAYRTQEKQQALRGQVSGMWGAEIRQTEPQFVIQTKDGDKTASSEMIVPESSTIAVSLDLEHRRKGLMWYPTFSSHFDASYEVRNDRDAPIEVMFRFAFPLEQATYDDVLIELDGKPLNTSLDIRQGTQILFPLTADGSSTVRVRYATRGLDRWSYIPSGAGRIRNLDLAVSTNFEAVDFSDDSLSPTSNVAAETGGRSITWTASDLLTSQSFAVIMPERLNPGPIAMRVTFFAPICLLFFFALTLLIQIRYDIAIHPMHYLFVAAGFFAFHLAFAYLVDVLNIHIAFWISALTSGGLVTFYMRGALGPTFPWRIAFGGQLIYLVLFSYSFFLQGITGLTLMVSSIVTLAVVMKLTVHTNWDEVFARRAAPPLPAGPVHLKA